MSWESIGKALEGFTVPADLAKKALEKPAQEIGDGLGDLFWLVFTPIRKARVKMEQSIERYKQDIQNEINKIPPDQIVEPQLSIVGPALEASKYYIEDEVIRSMFAKLIASSMTAELHHKAHPAFVEIIRQLSPIDAGVIRYLSANPLPVGRIRAEDAKGAGITLTKNFFPFPDDFLFPEDVTVDYDLFAASVDNLIRLGLMVVDFNSSYTDKSKYDVLHNHYFLKETQKLITNSGNPSFSDKKVVVKEGIWFFSDFGKQFLACCT